LKKLVRKIFKYRNFLKIKEEAVETLISDGSPEPAKKAVIDKIMAHYSKSNEVGRYTCNICDANGRTKMVAGNITIYIIGIESLPHNKILLKSVFYI
jgi:hypothetical protein